MAMVAVVGSRKSGKTRTVETLVRGLTEKGYKVATAKHIPEPDFTIDTKEKDTWRHANAGASTVVGVSPKEIAVIKKVDTTKWDLMEIVDECRDNVDIVILEGFRKLTEQAPQVSKIVTLKAADEISEAANRFKPILTFVGSMPTTAIGLKVPYVDVLQEPQKLVNLVDKRLAESVKRKKEREGKLKIQIDGKSLPMNPFVQKIMRSSLLAMVSTLKNATIEGKEGVSITIEKP